MFRRPLCAEKPWWDWEEANSWSSSTRWDSKPSGGHSEGAEEEVICWINATHVGLGLAQCFSRHQSTVCLCIFSLFGSVGTDICLSLSSSSSSHCFLSRSASESDEKKTWIETHSLDLLRHFPHVPLCIPPCVWAWRNNNIQHSTESQGWN